jgi:large subunit ribosomal protein L49
VPDPPVHESYPTPSGWVPIDVNKAKKLPYQVLRTRFHNYPIYTEEREGGTRKLVRIKHIQGDIWVK